MKIPAVSRRMMERSVLASLVSLALGWAPAGRGAEELRLPLGSPEAGLQAFVDLRCIHCHAVKGTPIEHPEVGKRLDLTLAADLRFVKSYPQLLTAITNPRHVIQQQYKQLLDPNEQASTEPFMLDLTSSMTVRQLIDILAFLDQSYAAQLPGYTPRP